MSTLFPWRFANLARNWRSFSVFFALLVLMLSASSASAITITRVSSTNFWTDNNNLTAMQYQYVAYSIYNDDGINYDSIWVTIGNFVGTVGVAEKESGQYNLGALPAGTNKVAYFYLKANSLPPNNGFLTATHDVTAYNGLPSLGAQVGFQDFSLRVEREISANANKVTGVTASPANPSLGGIVTITATGETGTVGGTRRVDFSPARDATWDATAFQIYEVVITFDAPNFGIYTNVLTFILANSASSTYTAVYKARVISTTTGPTPVRPLASIESGGSLKYTGAYQGTINPIGQATNGLVLAMSSVDCGGSSAVATNVTYSLVMSNSSPYDAYIDAFIDTLSGSPINATYVNNSTKTNNVAYSNPHIAGSQTLTWSGYFLIPGNSTNSLSFQATIPAVNGSYTNRAFAKIGTNQIDSTLTLNDNSPALCLYTIAPLSDIQVTKTGPASVNVTSNIVYTLTVTNLGPSTASNLVVIDQLPTNVTFVSASDGGFLQSGQVRWTNFLLFTNAQSTNLTVTVTAPLDSGTITNIASATVTTADPVATNNNGTATNAIVITTLVPFADLQASKTGPASVYSGTNFSYTITLTNFGPSTASNVVVRDVLPTNMVFVSASGSGVSNNGAVTWPTIATFTNGAVTNFTLTITAPLTNAILTNIVSSTSTTTDLVATNHDGTGTNAIVVTTVTPVADLITSKSGPGNVNAGSNIVYTITVTNLGPSIASNVVVSDVLPTNMVFVSASGSGISNNGFVTWPSIAFMTNGQSTNYTLTIVAPLTNSTLTNVVSSTSTTVDLVTTNNNGTGTNSIVTTTVTPISDIQTSKTGPASVNATSNVLYTITVTNLGPSTASNIVVSDILPTNIVFVSASAGGTSNNGVVTWPAITFLTNGGVTNFTLEITAPSNAVTLTNIISSLSSTADLVSTNNDGTGTNGIVLTAIVPVADVHSSKSGPASINATSNVLYTITVTNAGPSTASNIVVSDVLPADILFVSASAGGTSNNGAVTWPAIPALTNGGSTNFTLTVTAPANAATLTNIVSNTSTTLDLVVTNNNGTGTNAIVLTTVTPIGDVQTSKSGPSAVNATSNVVYTITVTNMGPSTASNIVVSDALPLDVLFVSATGGGTSNNGVVTWPNITLLTNGGTTNFTLTVTAPANHATLTNVVSSTSTTSDLVATNNNGTGTNSIVLTAVTPIGDVITSKIGPANVNATSNIVYTISVTNAGPSTASNIVVSDVLPPGVLYVSSTGGGASNNGVVTWPAITLLTNGGSSNFTLTVTAPSDAATLTNLVSSTSTTTDLIATNNNGTGTNGSVITTVTPIADVFASKSGPSTVSATSNVVYTITITNAGPSAASNIVVSDVLPVNTVFVSATGGGTSNNGVVTWPNITVLTNLEVTNFTVTVIAPPDHATLTNIVSSTSTTTDLTATNNNGTGANSIVITSVTPEADVKTSKSGPASVNATSNVVYTITVTNLGPSTASNIVVSDVLPADIIFVSASAGGSSNNGVVTWPAITTLTNGQVTNFTLEITAPANYATLTNIASSTSTTTDLIATNNNGTGTNAIVLTTVTPVGDLVTSKIGPANVNATSNVVYTITVTNLGPSTASNIVVSDVLPANTLFVSATGGGVSNNGVVTWPAITAMTNGQTTNFTLTISAPADQATLTNVVSSTSSTLDLVVTNHNGTGTNAIVITTVTPIGDVQTLKSGPATVAATSNVVYTVTVTNAGPSIASNIVVSDVLPANIVFVSATGGGVSNNGVVTWPTISALTNGAVTNFIVTVTAPAEPTMLTNIASSTSTTTDLIATNNNGTAAASIVITEVTSQADVQTSKTGPATVNAAESFAYTISVTNFGPSTASNIVVSDLLPAGVLFVSATSGGTSNNGSVTWPTLASFTNGASTNFTITVTAPPEGTLTNIASSTSTTADPVSTNNNGTATNSIVITTVIPQADVQTTKTGPTTVIATNNIIYTITVTNLGPSTASNVVVSDVLPLGVTFLSASGGGVNNSGTVEWPAISALTNGAVTNFTVTAIAPADGTITNTVSSTSVTADPVAANNNGTDAAAIVITTIDPCADVRTGKTGPVQVGLGTNIVYTITVTNFGPSVVSNVVVSDLVPPGLTFLSASGGGVNGGATVTWPAIAFMTNGATTNYTLTMGASSPGFYTNSVSSTADTTDAVSSNNDGSSPAARVITLVTAYTISGKVYYDGNKNAKFDTGEIGTGLTLFAKLLPSSSPGGPALQAISVNPGSGAYTLPNVTPGSYIILIDDNNSLADVIPTLPATWVGTEAPTHIRGGVLVNNVDVVNENFGLVEAITIRGTVFKDIGSGGGTANDGIRNGAETGLSGATVKLTDSTGATTYDTATTDGNGGYTLFVPNSIPNGTQLKVVELNLSSYRSVGASVGNTGGTYDRNTDTITFTRATGTLHTGVDFGDVPDNQFVNDGQQAGLPGTTVFYSHIFTAGSVGQVTFSSISAPNPAIGWSHVLYRDSNCNGQLDPGEPALSGSIAMIAGERVCIIVKEFIPPGAPLSAQDRITVTASFSYSNANPALTSAHTCVDVTTVGTATTTALALLKAVDKATALPGETITYIITYKNNGSDDLKDVVIFDMTPSYTTFISAANSPLPANLTGVVLVAPSVGSTGEIKWTFSGTLAPGAGGTVTFQVKVD